MFFRDISVSLAGRREIAFSNIPAVAFDSLERDRTKQGILAYKFWFFPHAETQQIGENEDLSIAVRAGSYADGRYLQRTCDPGRQRRRDALEHYAEDVRFLEGEGIIEQLSRILGRLSLDLVAAHGMDRLGRQADMSHHGDPVGGQPGRGRRRLRA